MRRTILLVCVFALLLASCSTGTGEGRGREPTGSAELLAVGGITDPDRVPVLRASVGWDGRTCRYVGPGRWSEDDPIRLRLEDRSGSGYAGLVLSQLPATAQYGRFVEWSATHVVNFYSTFPPSRFIVPGRWHLYDMATRDAASIDPLPRGRYFLACVFWPPDARGSSLRPAALVEVVEPG